MPRYLYPDQMARLRRKAFLNGGHAKVADDIPRPRALPRMEWHVSGNCTEPVTVDLVSRPELKRAKSRVMDANAHTQMMTVEARCRKCENCLKAKAAHWRFRALAEYRAAPRTWLLTLTLTPEEQFRALNRARRHIDAQGLDFDALSTAEQFELRHRETGRLVTLYLKRLRKVGNASFRYLMVAEAHQTGLPHYHVLLHELSGADPVRHRTLVQHWTYGFAKANLVDDPKGATYCVKYLTKSVLARVRASVGYGGPNTPHVLGHKTS